MQNTSYSIDFSIVSPVYKAELIVDELVKRIVASVSKLSENFEIILVEDCGGDGSWDKIVENCKKDKRVKGIKLSRNFGQHYAITAGLDHCKGQWVVVMDCDLQDQPEEIINLYAKAQEGYDIVFARRSLRQDSFFKKLSSRMFYKVFSYLSGVEQDGTIANFGIYHADAIRSVNSMREAMRGFSTMIRWVGFKSTAIDVEHAARFEGKTSYNWKKLINLALDIALAYSDKPLKLIIKAGFIISILSIILAVYYLVSYILGNIKVPGYASLVVCICFLSGLIILINGIIGLYISKIFDNVKQRPLYFEKHKINI